jgi:transcriptional regulator with XRE-family HTH domain
VSIIGEIERGNRLATGDLLQKIGQTLNISLEELAPTED